jgi:hypothetical protein
MGDDVNVISLNLLGVKTYVLRHPDEMNFMASAAGMKIFEKGLADRLGGWLGQFISFQFFQ